MMGKSRADCVIPVLFLVGKCYPGEVPDSFLKVMFSSSLFWGKSGSSEGVRKVNVGVTSRNLVVFDCDIMRSTSNCLSNEHDNHRIFDHAGVLDGLLPSKTTANQVSQMCISKLWLRVIHGSWCTVHDGLCIMLVTRRMLHDTSRTMNVASGRMHETRCISHTT